MTTYWWLIGTIGTRTPTIRATCAAYIPAASTTSSHSTSPRSVRTPVTAPPAVSDAQDAGALAHLHAGRARTLGQRVGELGRVQVPVGRQERRTRARRSVDISGNSSRASSAESRCSSRPNVSAQPTCRSSSSIRSGVHASRRPPHSTQPGSVSGSAASERYSRALSIIIRVSVTEPRS